MFLSAVRYLQDLSYCSAGRRALFPTSACYLRLVAGRLLSQFNVVRVVFKRPTVPYELSYSSRFRNARKIRCVIRNPTIGREHGNMYR